MGKRLTIEYVIELFAKEGYTVLSKEYVNRDHKLSFRCPNGHHHSISFQGWKIGNRCPYCSGKAKKTIEEVKQDFEREGYILLTNKYKNASTYLHYICPEGHIHRVRRYNWHNGVRCPYCAGQIKPEISEIKDSFDKEGYQLLSDSYQDNKAMLKYRCPVGHEHSISWLKWNQGRRCRECSYIKRGLNNSGPNSNWWRGGISCEPYCQDWTKEYKEFIKERDGYSCLNPSCLKKDDRLVVHHINYIKKDCSPRNLITVCNTCNLKANYDREWHTAWYQALMYRRYNYLY